LLSDPANKDYQSRVDECNNEVENIASIEDVAKSTVKKKDANIDVADLVDQYIDDPELAAKILAAFGSKKTKILASEALKKFSEMIKNADKQIKTVEQAHFTFTTSQLAVYENAKDVVKKMAVNGLNIVGDFVQNAVNEATRGGGPRRM
jgi:oligoribonuclease NrnB/cAMP/cGMP phosphodiesterase (DHH superfamily)